MSRHISHPRWLLMGGSLITACCLLAGCIGGEQTQTYAVRMSGDPARGKAFMEIYGCGACHVIPGVHNARGMVGPPLLMFSRRTIIAGELPNSPENLVRWIKNPVAIEPATAMPNLGVTDNQAHDMAAYLYTLQ